ncbi:MAG TPA: hypothetical protein VJA85_02055 [Candidatus Limnocylindria bacterium]|nr:hypothetical protein [Candidatus Limnocylindria bacterium]
MTGTPMNPLDALISLGGALPMLVAIGWLIRVPPLSREEGHEAITRQAWEGLQLTDEHQRALIRGVRAPDVSLAGILTSAVPSAQRRHALRAWSGDTTAQGVQDARDFIVSTHLRALAMPDGPRRWATFGEVLHCLQDSYSPAHTDRAGGRIVRMKHWGPLDGLRAAGRGAARPDEHRFPSDARDSVWRDGALTDAAQAAVAASHRYLEIVVRDIEIGVDQTNLQSDLFSLVDGVPAAETLVGPE